MKNATGKDDFWSFVNMPRRKHAYARNAGFSLLELMAVMLLMFIMMGIATTAFRGIMQGAGLRGSTAVVRGTLTQARQQAMTHGQRVAVIIEQGDHYGTMRTVMSFGRVLDVTGGGVIRMENDMPWTASEIAGSTVYNFDGDSATMGSDEDIADSTVFYRAPGLGQGDEVAFQVGTVRELPSGLAFGGVGGNLVIIFDTDGSALSGGAFEVVERRGSGGFTIEVDGMSGRVSVGDLD